MFEIKQKTTGKLLFSTAQDSLLGVDMTGRVMEGADAAYFNFTGAIMNDVNLNYADLSRATFSRADLRKANLQEANLVGAVMDQADLTRANLTRARMGKARLHKAQFNSANLSKAVLADSDLRGANFATANLAGADLHGAIYDEQTRWPKGFTPASRGARMAEKQTNRPAKGQQWRLSI